MDTTYISGFVHGAFAAVIFYYIWGRISKANSTIKQKNKPLDTFPDAAQPNLTPAGIVWKSTLARLAWFLWLVAMLVFIVILFWSLQVALISI